MTQYEADQAEIERRIADAVEAALKNTEGVRARLAESEKQVILCDEQIEAARREEREQSDALWIKHAEAIRQEGIQGFENPMLALAARVALERLRGDK